jgi:hypothetical protein
VGRHRRSGKHSATNPVEVPRQPATRVQILCLTFFAVALTGAITRIDTLTIAGMALGLPFFVIDGIRAVREYSFPKRRA